MAIRALKWFAGVALMLISIDAKAGPETLDSLIQVGLKNNQSVAASVNRYQSMKSEAGAAGALPDPEFTISAMNLPRTTLSLTEMDMSGISVGGMQTIPWPGMLSAKSRVAKLGAEVEASDVRSIRNSIVRKIKHYYFEYSYWTFAGNLIDENIKLSGQIIDYIENRYSNGSGSMSEVVSARISKNEMENEKFDVESEKRAALLMLKQLVNDTSAADTNLSPFLSFQLDEIPDDVPDYSKNPELIGASTKYQVARAKHSLAKSEYWPEFMIGADYLIRKYDSAQASLGHIAFPGEDMWSFHVGFTLPLWFFSKQNKMTKAARYEMASSQAEEQAVDVELKQSIREAQIKLRTIKQRTKHFIESIIPLSEAAYNSSHVAYEVGQVDFQKLLEDQMAVYMSKLEHIKLVKDYFQTKAYLDELVGLEYGEKLPVVENKTTSPAH